MHFPAALHGNMHSPDVTETSFTESKKERKKDNKERGGGMIVSCKHVPYVHLYKAVLVGVLGIITMDYQVLSV